MAKDRQFVLTLFSYRVWERKLFISVQFPMREDSSCLLLLYFLFFILRCSTEECCKTFPFFHPLRHSFARRYSEKSLQRRTLLTFVPFSCYLGRGRQVLDQLELFMVGIILVWNKSLVLKWNKCNNPCNSYIFIIFFQAVGHWTKHVLVPPSHQLCW